MSLIFIFLFHLTLNIVHTAHCLKSMYMEKVSGAHRIIGNRYPRRERAFRSLRNNTSSLHTRRRKNRRPITRNLIANFRSRAPTDADGKLIFPRVLFSITGTLLRATGKCNFCDVSKRNEQS